MFVERIKYIRKQHKETQQEMADRIGVSQRSVASWENGTRMPSYDVLISIANVYSVTTDYLLGRTDDPQLYRHELPMPEGYSAYALSTRKEAPSPDIGERALEYAQKNAIPLTELTDTQGRPVDLETWLQDRIQRVVQAELQKQSDHQQPPPNTESPEGRL